MKNNYLKGSYCDYRTWIEIDSQAFNHNIQQIHSLTDSKADIGIVLKAHAYGHDIKLIGKLCQENKYVSWLFTASLKEAITLRMSGVTKSILVLGYIDDDSNYFIDYNLVCAVSDVNMAQQLSYVAAASKKKISVHIKVDTGMSRLGFQLDDITASINYMRSLEGLSIEGIFTHLSDTNNSDYSFSTEQLSHFDKMVTSAEGILSKKLYRHVISSGALHMRELYDCVRVGTNAYGYWKSSLQEQRLSVIKPDITLIPVLTWKTRIQAIKNINPGDAVGYHRAFIATSAMKIAILPVGYYDGYPRGLTYKARVLIKQKYAPVIGIISMNLMVADVTHIDSAQITDQVTLCGDFPGISAVDLAVVTDSIQNEFLSRIPQHIPRILM